MKKLKVKYDGKLRIYKVRNMELEANISEFLAGYTPIRPLGQGGMASIYLYENRITGDLVAVKSLHPHIANEKDSISRFFHEVQATIRLDHKNIVKVLGYGDWHKKPSIVMEYIDGGDLKSLSERVSIIPTEMASYIVFQILKGLDYSHRLGIIHRDIKPSNILIDRGGQIKIADFGISRVSDLTRLTQSGDILGTPAYMSPEQAAGQRVDERSDLFSAGVILYELLTGKNPFIAENPSITLLNIIRCNPVPIFETNPTVPFQLDNVCDTLLSKLPDRRFQTAAEASSKLKSFLIDEFSDGIDASTFQKFLDNPEEYRRQQVIKDSKHYFENGKALLTDAKDSPEQAAIEFYKTLFLDPDNYEAQQYITSITEKFGSSNQESNSRKILELEEFLEKDPNNVAVLLQLVKQYRLDGNILKAVAYSKRLARLRPKDTYILGQINTLLPREQSTAIFNKSQDDPERTLTQYQQTYKQLKTTPSKMISTDRKSIRRINRGVDPLLLFGSIGVLLAIIVAMIIGSQVKKVSETVTLDLKKFSKQEETSSDFETSDDTARISGRAKELMQKIQRAVDANDKDRVFKAYQEFLSEFPSHSQSDRMRLQLAELYNASGYWNEALKVLDDQIKVGRNHNLQVEARYIKIEILLEASNSEEARWECIHLEPDYPNLSSNAQKTEYLLKYANLCEEVNDFNKAIFLYEKVIKDSTNKSKNLEARINKSSLLIEMGNIFEAQRDLWKIKDETPPGNQYHQEAIALLEKLGQNNE